MFNEWGKYALRNLLEGLSPPQQLPRKKACGKCGGRGHHPSVCATGVTEVCEDSGEFDSDFGILEMEQLNEDSRLFTFPGELDMLFLVDKDDKTQCIEN